MKRIEPFAGTAEEHAILHARWYEKLFVASVIGWAMWGPVPARPREASLGRLRWNDWPRFVLKPAWMQWRSPSSRA